MRRPAMTAAQRRHAREQRALRALRRAAVRYLNAVDGSAHIAAVFGGKADGDLEARGMAATEIVDAETELAAAAQRYGSALPMSERRRMGRRR